MLPRSNNKQSARSAVKPALAVLAVAVSCALASVAAAQQASPADVHDAAKKDGKTLEKIVVTGSNLATTSAAMEGPVPVTVIDAKELKITGVTTVFQALQSQPFFVGDADNDTRAGASGHSGVNLRGLGEQYTLVLLNGRRMANADLNQVPFAAVDRIEILRDGASAVYGADAVAGVVNIILKQDYDGFQVNAGYGNTTHFNDGMRSYVSFVTGMHSDRGSMLISAQFEKQNSILCLEDSRCRTDDQRSLGGADLRSDRYNPGLVTLADGTRLMLNPSFGAGQTGHSPNDYVSPYQNLIDKRQFNNLQNGKHVATLYSGGHYDLLDKRLVFFYDAMYKKSDLDIVDHRGTYLDYDVPAANYWNPFHQNVHVRYLLDYGRERRSESMTSEETNTLVTVGLRGNLDSFSYELAYSDSESKTEQTHDGLSRELIEASLARSDPSALNLFGNQAVTSDELAAARRTFTRSWKYWVRSLSGVVRFEPLSLPGGTVSSAVGFEKRWLGVRSTPDSGMQAGDVASLTFLNDGPGAGSRTVDSVYAETNVPLFGAANAIAGVHALDLGLAVRREKFSDFGSATVPRMSLRWEPFDNSSLMLRGSYSESFYAPNVADLVPSGDVNTDYFTDPRILDAHGKPLVYEMTIEGGGNPHLQPAKGKYYDIGAVYSPDWLEGFTTQIDWWRLDQTNAFITPTVQSVLNGWAAGTVERSSTLTPGDHYAGAPVGRVTRVINTIVNGGTRYVRGIDLNLLYSRDTDRFGRWNFGLYNTFMTKFAFNQQDGNGDIDALGNLLWASIPKYRGKFDVSNTWGPWTTSLTTSYYGNIKNSFYNNASVGFYRTTDLAVTYDFDRAESKPQGFGGTTISLRVSNLFDESIPVYLSYDLRSIASNYSYADYVGQFVSLQVSKKF